VKAKDHVPIGISTTYDILPRVGLAIRINCQRCERDFVDRKRVMYDGAWLILAVFCAECRAEARTRYAPLPIARTVRRPSWWTKLFGRT
jgi:hypothetical protein